jgi:hypothetical protein
MAAFGRSRAKQPFVAGFGDLWTTSREDIATLKFNASLL